MAATCWFVCMWFCNTWVATCCLLNGWLIEGGALCTTLTLIFALCMLYTLHCTIWFTECNLANLLIIQHPQILPNYFCRSRPTSGVRLTSTPSCGSFNSSIALFLTTGMASSDGRSEKSHQKLDNFTTTTSMASLFLIYFSCKTVSKLGVGKRTMWAMVVTTRSH